jgi:hypothetical protein
MNQEILLKSLNNLKDKVKNNLRKSGIVVPIKTKRGVKLEDYEVILESNGYTVYDRWGEALYSGIYYLQTAILVANTLATKRTVKDSWLIDDRTAGSNDFDMMLFDTRYKSSVKKNDTFGMGFYKTRYLESRRKHSDHIKPIENAYQGLLNTLKSFEKTNKYTA